ncbi:MAG: hypothetical protein GWP14_03315 [Actinobacteria bacterium]|nr:hypothetical protein [Actinomycetota bacterium]
MKTIILISCVKTKLPQPAMAKDLYVSDFFQKAYQYAQLLNADGIFILSAKYGLLPPERIIEPYEMTLMTMKIAERKEWSSKVLEELRQYTDLKRDKFIFLCGAKYRQYLLPEICNYEVPMEGLGIGRQKHWLKEKLEHGCMSRITSSIK